MKNRLAALLCALSLLTGPARAAGKAPVFSDVPPGEWYAQAVQEVTEKGLMAGTEPGLFGPEEVVTRAMVIVVLWKLEGAPQPSSTVSFSDVSPGDPVSGWYSVPAAWARENRVASGHEDGTFRGDDPVTREELAAFLYSYALYQGQPAASGYLGYFDDADQISDWARDAVRHAVGMGLLRGDERGLLNPGGHAIRCELASVLQRMLVPAAG